MRKPRPNLIEIEKEWPKLGGTFYIKPGLVMRFLPTQP